MGFNADAAARALAAVEGSVPAAVDWLATHSGDAGVDAPFTAEGDAGAAATPVSKSIRCVATGKLFKSMAAAQLYAERTGRSDFEECEQEIVPLTDEEKAAKAAALRQKLATKRRAREEEEKQEKKQAEKRRRADGAALLQVKEQMAAQQIARDQALRRKEKQRQADERVRLRIEVAKNKAERAAAQALREGRPPPAPPSFEAAARAPRVEKSSAERLKLLADALEARRTGGVGLTALSTLLIYVKNAATKEDEKFRSINKGNKAFVKRVGHLRPAAAFLRLAGFDDVAASDAFPQGRFVLRAGVERAALDEAIAILTESKRVATASAT
jgi:hypothetical protein